MSLVDSNNPSFSGVALLNGLEMATQADLAELKNLLNQELPDLIMELAYNGGVSSSSSGSGSSSGGSGGVTVTDIAANTAFGWIEDWSETLASLMNGTTLDISKLPKFKDGTSCTADEVFAMGFTPARIKLRGNFKPTGHSSDNGYSGWTGDEFDLSLALAFDSGKTHLVVNPSATFRRYSSQDAYGIYRYTGSPDQTVYTDFHDDGLLAYLNFFLGLWTPSTVATLTYNSQTAFTTLADLNTALAAGGYDQVVNGKYWYDKAVPLKAWILAGR